MKSLWRFLGTPISGQPFARLLRGASLSPSDGPCVDGRLDLRGSQTSTHNPSNKKPATPGTEFTISNAVWHKLDFTESSLRGLQLDNVKVDDCCFAKSDCSGWRLWGTSIHNTSFREADLRNAVLGAVEKHRRNLYQNVDFSFADMRSTIYESSDFFDCDFSNARLRNVDFQGSVFRRCRFSGDLSDIIFQKYAFRGEHLPANDLSEVDFTAARLRYAEFRGLDLDSVRWPIDEHHIVLHDFRNTLDRIIVALKAMDGPAARQVQASLEHTRKWAGAKQTTGIISKREIAEAGDPTLIAIIENFANSVVP